MIKKKYGHPAKAGWPFRLTYLDRNILCTGNYVNLRLAYHSIVVQMPNATETEVLPDTMDDRVILILTPVAYRFILSHMNIKQRLLQILNVEQAHHPRMTGQDLQKLAYQASLGCDHFLGKRKQFEQDLCQEWNKLNASTNIQEYPLQVIDPFGKTARLHLSPCKPLGLSLEELVALLVAQPNKDGKKRIMIVCGLI